MRQPSAGGWWTPDRGAAACWEADDREAGGGLGAPASRLGQPVRAATGFVMEVQHPFC